MGIKLDHVHENGKSCYRVTSRHNVKDSGFFRYDDSNIFGAYYMPYTGHWYAFNLDTGEQIASFTKDYFEKFVSRFRVADVVKDPDCVPVKA